MKTTVSLFLSVIALSFAVVGFTGCGDDTTSSSAGDMAVATVHDLAAGAVHDLADTGGDGGLKPLAAACTGDGECASGTCAPYAGGTKMLCSYHCTANMPAPMCTTPGDGTCNGMSYCKFPGM